MFSSNLGESLTEIIFEWLSTGYKPVFKKNPKISLLFPFKSRDPHRRKVFKWVLNYWKCQLPDAEIIIGRSNSKPFCKTEALNDAAARAHGKVLVIIDADAYMDAKVIDECADKILEELELGNNLWFVPYRKLFRLTEAKTLEIIDGDFCTPFDMPVLPPVEWIDGDWSKSSYGHRYGAMVMMFPREALDALGCFDERFKGWGGEDVAFLRALDVLWGKHKTTNNPLYHLWHPYIGNSYISRAWRGQKKEQPNRELAMAYHRARRSPERMREVVTAGCLYRKYRAKYHRLHPKRVFRRFFE